MVWWGWILIGSLLLCSEIALVDAGFYLVFFGVAAILVGLLDLSPLAIPVWAEWLLFAALCVLLITSFRRRLHARMRGSAPVAGAPVQAGDTGTASAAIAVGGSGRATVGGSTWMVKNAGAQAIAEAAPLRVRSVAGLVLEVEAAGAPAAPASVAAPVAAAATANPEPGGDATR